MQKSNPDAKEKKRKNTKDKAKVSDAAIPRKRARTEDDPVPVKDKLAPKKPKLKETVVVDEDEREFTFFLSICVILFLVPFLSCRSYQSRPQTWPWTCQTAARYFGCQWWRFR